MTRVDVMAQVKIIAHASDLRFLHGSAERRLLSRMTTWHENLTEFDTNFVPLQNTGSDAVDGNINALIRQISALRKAAESGFTKMQSVIANLDQYDYALKDDLLAIKKEMLTGIDPGIALGVKMDTVTTKLATMGNMTESMVMDRVNAIELRILQLEDNNKNKFVAIDRILDKPTNGLQTTVSDGGAVNTSGNRKRSLLESKAIQGLKTFDGDRATYKEYLHKSSMELLVYSPKLLTDIQ